MRKALLYVSMVMAAFIIFWVQTNPSLGECIGVVFAVSTWIFVCYAVLTVENNKWKKKWEYEKEREIFLNAELKLTNDKRRYVELRIKEKFSGLSDEEHTEMCVLISEERKRAEIELTSVLKKHPVKMEYMEIKPLTEEQQSELERLLKIQESNTRVMLQGEFDKLNELQRKQFKSNFGPEVETRIAPCPECYRNRTG